MLLRLLFVSVLLSSSVATAGGPIGRRPQPTKRFNKWRDNPRWKVVATTVLTLGAATIILPAAMSVLAPRPSRTVHYVQSPADRAAPGSGRFTLVLHGKNADKNDESVLVTLAGSGSAGGIRVVDRVRTFHYEAREALRMARESGRPARAANLSSGGEELIDLQIAEELVTRHGVPLPSLSKELLHGASSLAEIQERIAAAK